MKSRMKHVPTALVLGLSISFSAGCNGPEEPEPIGTATAELLLAPTSVRCINIKTVNGTTTINNAFNVAPGGNTTFALSSLPVGSDTFTAQAYAVPCANIATATATHVSDTVTAVVSATPVKVSLPMRPASGGTGTASVTFPTPAGTVTSFPVYSLPYLLALGADGNIWYSVGGNMTIGVLSPSGGFAEYATPDYAFSLAPAPDGTVWFAGYSAWVGRMTSTGTVTTYGIPSGNTARRVALGSDGNVWFTEPAGKIGRLSPITQQVTEFTVPTSVPAPEGIAAGSDGNLWFAERIGNKIGRITTAGVITEFPIPTSGSTPISITAGPDGNLWFVETATQKIGRITTAGVITEFPIPAPGSTQGSEITAGPDGNLWISEPNAGMIARLTPAGVFATFGLPGVGPQPYGITAGPDGAIWYADLAGRSSIGRLSL